MIVPLIVAAGASSRMGRLKAVCDFDGRTCLELALDACREAGLAPPIVVLGFHGDAIRQMVPLGDATIVTNEWAERGQTSSLKTGLRALSDTAEAFLLYPVDFPLVTAAEVRLICAAWRARGSGERILIPSHDRRRGHPVVFDATLRDTFLQLADDAPARDVVEAFAHQIAYVECETPSVLIDMDTPADYASCLAAFRRRHAVPVEDTWNRRCG